jgi:hypothetical protein
MVDNHRRVQAIALIAMGVIITSVSMWISHGFLSVYGDPYASGVLQGLGSGLGAILIVALLAVVAMLLLRSWAGVATAVVLMLLALGGSALAGQLALQAKHAKFVRVPDCLLTTQDGYSPTEVANGRRIQDAVEALTHPAPFRAGFYTKSGHSCSAILVTKDLRTTVAFYRQELPAKGWTITEDTPERLSATSGNLNLDVNDYESAGITLFLSLPVG